MRMLKPVKNQKGISTLISLAIILAFAVVSFGVIFGYQYYLDKNNQISNQNTEKISKKISDTKKTVTVKENFLFSIVNSNIEIKNRSNNTLIQKIPLDRWLVGGNLSVNDIVFFNEDINFDGYKDLKIMSTLAATNAYYDYFIYDPSIEKFNADSLLKNLPSPTFDSKTRTIKSYMALGCAGGYFSEAILSFINGKYILTSTRQGACCGLEDEESGGIIISELKNGQMEVIRRDPCP